MQTSRCRQNQPLPKAVLVPAQNIKCVTEHHGKAGKPGTGYKACHAAAYDARHYN